MLGKLQNHQGWLHKLVAFTVTEPHTEKVPLFGCCPAILNNFLIRDPAFILQQGLQIT